MITAPELRWRSKIVELDELGRLLEALRAQGKTIAQCHGVFDLLHIGHLRHFSEAKRIADIVVVTLTQDCDVNKGPHRPAFTENVRAEALASLADVDYVTISRSPTAVAAIRAIRPTYYVKGPDYKDASKDVTGNIRDEENAVKASGGQLYFTESETHSSSTLLNRHLPSFPDDVERYLSALREKYSADDVIAELDRLRTMNVTLAGEAILDEYVYVDQMGKSAKDPVLAMRYVDAEVFAGGSLAVANHLASFCNSVELLTYIGSENGQESFIRNHLKSNVRTNFIYKSGSPTIVKRRYVEKSFLTKLFEVYIINDEMLTEEEESRLCELLDARVEKSDAVIVADFGHGMLTKKARKSLSSCGRFLAVNTQVNAANIRFHAISNYERADYVCINEGELRLDARSRREPVAELIAGLSKRLGCENFLVTRGKQGVAFFCGDQEVESPSLAHNVVDRTGSGDAVLAITSLCAAAKMPPDMIAFIANVIGAQKVQIVGNRTSIERAATVKFIQALLK